MPVSKFEIPAALGFFVVHVQLIFVHTKQSYSIPSNRMQRFHNVFASLSVLYTGYNKRHTRWSLTVFRAFVCFIAQDRFRIMPTTFRPGEDFGSLPGVRRPIVVGTCTDTWSYYKMSWWWGGALVFMSSPKSRPKVSAGHVTGPPSPSRPQSDRVTYTHASSGAACNG